MHVQVLGQTILHALVSPLLIVWALLFSLVSVFTKGNAIVNPKVIFITGASSGLGYSLAVKYATRGVVLGLAGRNKDRLDAIKTACEKKGAKVELVVMDVNNRKAVKDALTNFDRNFPIDIMIANAGVSASTCESSEDAEEAFFNVFCTNALGVANSVVPVIPLMKQRKKGQIVVMGSLASEIAPISGSANSYAASKAAVGSMAASWRTQLKPFGIGVTLIQPGFVKTPLTDKNDFHMPMMIDSETAIKIMVDGIAKDYAVVAFPALMYWGIWLLRIIPFNLFSMVPLSNKVRL